MEIRKVKEEMQFLTNIVTNDVDYLAYLLLKQEKKAEVLSVVPDTAGKSFVEGELLDDWFNNL